MFALRRLTVAAAYLAGAIASTGASAVAKDENAAEWLAPKWLNEWHDGLAAKGLNFGAVWIGDNIGNVSGGSSRGAIHFGRFDLPSMATSTSWSAGAVAGSSSTAPHLRPRPVTQLCPQPRHHQRDRSPSGGASVQRLFRAGPRQRRAQLPDRPTGRRCRVLRQPDRRSLRQRHVRLARQQGEQSSGWRAGPADRGARHSGQGRPVGPGHPVRGGVQRHSSPPGDGEPQLRDNHGLAFRVNDPPWPIGQVRWSYDLDFGRRPLAGNFTPGGWYHSGQFDDQRFTAQGELIAEP